MLVISCLELPFDHFFWELLGTLVEDDGRVEMLADVSEI